MSKRTKANQALDVACKQAGLDPIDVINAMVETLHRKAHHKPPGMAIPTINDQTNDTKVQAINHHRRDSV